MYICIERERHIYIYIYMIVIIMIIIIIIASVIPAVSPGAGLRAAWGVSGGGPGGDARRRTARARGIY